MNEQNIYRLPQVLSRLGVSRSTLYNWIKSGKFKRPLKLSPRTSAWLSTDIDSFIQSRIDRRDNMNAEQLRVLNAGIKKEINSSLLNIEFTVPK